MSDSLKRSHSCGLLTKEAAGEQVVLCGWVAKRRDHGGLIFVDLRDRSGIVQIVVDPDDAGNSFTTAEAIRSEYVIKVAGKVRLRDAATVNPNLATGEIEVVAADLEVLNAAKTPPFYIQDDIDTDENLRLKYRYLDLRRPEMQKNLILRHKVTKLMRDYMDKNGFCEIETPMLTKSTPEGARDYLVPSEKVEVEIMATIPSNNTYYQLCYVFAGEETQLLGANGPYSPPKWQLMVKGVTEFASGVAVAAMEKDVPVTIFGVAEEDDVFFASGEGCEARLDAVVELSSSALRVLFDRGAPLTTYHLC
mgnify:CR=1 FL=1